MSYAAAAAKGPKQSPEEPSPIPQLTLPPPHNSRAPPVPEIVHTEDPETESLIDVDSTHVNTVPSDFQSHPVKTHTQADRLEHDAAAAEAQAKDKARALKHEAAEKEKAAEQQAGKFSKSISENRDNPVVLGNAILGAVLGAVLGYGAYKKYAQGELGLKVVAGWTGVVGLVAAGDYYLSQYLFKNKYPRK